MILVGYTHQRRMGSREFSSREFSSCELSSREWAAANIAAANSAPANFTFVENIPKHQIYLSYLIYHALVKFSLVKNIRQKMYECIIIIKR